MSYVFAIAPEIGAATAAAQAVGAIAVVVLFLRHLKEERDSRETIDVARHEALVDLGNKCHEHSRAMMAAVERTTETSNAVIQESSRQMGRLAVYLDKDGSG